MQIRADFHTHSIGEAVFGPSVEDLIARHIDAAAEVGLDCLAVSDHNDLRPGLIAREYAARHGLPLLVLPAMELTTAERVHLLAIGLEEPIEAWRPLEATIARIREVGGISILPHPFFAHLRDKRDVDAIEQYNSRYGDFNLDGTTVARVADSDSHSPEDLRQSQYCTILELVTVSWRDVADAVRAGRTVPSTCRDTVSQRGASGKPPDWRSEA
jgi:predicted metal-dependent phosphoesterase TrpH